MAGEDRAGMDLDAMLEHHRARRAAHLHEFLRQLVAFNFGEEVARQLNLTPPTVDEAEASAKGVLDRLGGGEAEAGDGPQSWRDRPPLL